MDSLQWRRHAAYRFAAKIAVRTQKFTLGHQPSNSLPPGLKLNLGLEAHDSFRGSCALVTLVLTLSAPRIETIGARGAGGEG